MEASPHELMISWAAIYHPEWDETPGMYIEQELVSWGHSRRLARIEDRRAHFKAYLGVQHYDPARWHTAGQPSAKFFLSLFVGGRTITLRTFPTLRAAHAELERFYTELIAADSRGNVPN